MAQHSAYEFHVLKNPLTQGVTIHIILRDRALKPLLISYIEQNKLLLNEIVFNDTYIEYEIWCELEQVSMIYHCEQMLSDYAQHLQISRECNSLLYAPVSKADFAS